MYIKKAEILSLNGKEVQQKMIDKLANHKCVDGMTYINNGKITITLMDGQKIEVIINQ